MTAVITIAPFLDKVNSVVLNPLIGLVFVIAFLIFLFGILQFINKAADPKAREEGKKKIIYGLVGMFIMFSAYGLIHLILVTFGIQNETGASAYLKL